MSTPSIEHGLIWILSLAILALVIGVIQFRRSRTKASRLAKDSSGLWRYHPETIFKRKAAYGKKLAKAEKKADLPVAEAESGEQGEVMLPIAVLEFDGDMKASGHEAFARLVDEIEVNRLGLSEVVVAINSPGGAVPHYGHLYSQIS